MQQLISSIGWRRLICLLEGSHAILAESVKELSMPRSLRCYLCPLAKEDVFKGMSPPGGDVHSSGQEHVTFTQSMEMTPASTPEGGAVAGVTRDPAMEKRGH